MRSPGEERTSATHGAVVRLSGTIGRDEAQRLDSMIRDLVLRGAPTVVIDIAAVDEVNGALLGVLVRATRRLSWRNGRTVIVCPRADLRRGLEIAGLDHLAEVCEAWPALSSVPPARSLPRTPAPPSRAC